MRLSRQGRTETGKITKTVKRMSCLSFKLVGGDDTGGKVRLAILPTHTVLLSGVGVAFLDLDGPSSISSQDF
jgi:hypothetical protein